ncbi:MAG: SRPBCC family protein [Bacillota bacterium]
MVDVITEIDIHAPVNKVADYASNPDNAPKWYDNIETVEWRSPKPLALGTLVAFKAKFLGRELAYIYEIVEYTNGAKLVMRTSEGPFPMETTYTWETKGADLTTMTLRNRGVPSGFSKLLAPFMASMMRKANNKDLKKIKALLENE